MLQSLVESKHNDVTKKGRNGMARESKDMLTRIIIPAPQESNQESGVNWYEVLTDPARKSTRIGAFDREKRNIAEAHGQIVTDYQIRTVIRDGQTHLTIEVKLDQDDSGVLRAEGTINNISFVISDRPVEGKPANVSRTADLSMDELRVLSQWSRLTHSLDAVVQATRQSYGCGPCIVMGLGITVGVGACAAGIWAACAGVLTSGGTFLEQCQGSCADPEPPVA